MFREELERLGEKSIGYLANEELILGSGGYRSLTVHFVDAEGRSSKVLVGVRKGREEDPKPGESPYFVEVDLRPVDPEIEGFKGHKIMRRFPQASGPLAAVIVDNSSGKVAGEASFGTSTAHPGVQFARCPVSAGDSEYRVYLKLIEQ
jgi:hypothetical protein